jgi:acetoacetyl-[acyl-carrier protein] synthase
VQAHGTSTEQNRVTESHILNEIAKTYALTEWPVTSIKAYVGHSMGTAAGDQLSAALGVWRYGWIPGIKTIDHIAEDVNDSHLDILMADKFVGQQGEQIKAAILNAKGFGGNNASGLILSPKQTMQMLANKHGVDAMDDYKAKNIAVAMTAEQADELSQYGAAPVIYDFGTSTMDKQSVSMTTSHIGLSTFANKIKMPDAAEFGCYL